MRTTNLVTFSTDSLIILHTQMLMQNIKVDIYVAIRWPGFLSIAKIQPKAYILIWKCEGFVCHLACKSANLINLGEFRRH